METDSENWIMMWDFSLRKAEDEHLTGFGGMKDDKLVEFKEFV